VIDNDSVDVPSENDRDGGLVLGLGGLAEIDDSSVNTWFREERTNATSQQSVEELARER